MKKLFFLLLSLTQTDLFSAQSGSQYNLRDVGRRATFLRFNTRNGVFELPLEGQVSSLHDPDNFIFHCGKETYTFRELRRRFNILQESSEPDKHFLRGTEKIFIEDRFPKSLVFHVYLSSLVPLAKPLY